MRKVIVTTSINPVTEAVRRFQAMKEGREEAPRCGKCDWCRRSKVITGAVDADELEGGGV